jgi:uncharacterized protein (TIGR03435 family)
MKKKTKLCTVGPILLSLCCVALTAQQAPDTKDIAGTWQGTLPAGKSPRMIFKIEKTSAGALTAINCCIAQTGVPAHAKSVTVQGSAIRIDMMSVGGIFEGTLDADAKTITGTWTQGAPLPLVLTRATAATEWSMPEPPPTPAPMASDAKPSFEVASIRPTNPDTRGTQFLVSGRHYTTKNTSAAMIFIQAYELHPSQLTGAPGWMNTDRWDISAQPDLPGQPSEEQWKQMLQSLLADRFHLTFHTEKKDMKVFVLTRIANGPVLTPSDGNPDGVPHINGRGRGHLFAQDSNMRDFADILQQAFVDRPVLNQTGLTGRFDFTLDWTPDEAPAAADDADDRPSLFRALEQQLGLKLTLTRAPADVYVIDHVDRPSAN